MSDIDIDIILYSFLVYTILIRIGLQTRYLTNKPIGEILLRLSCVISCFSTD